MHLFLSFEGGTIRGEGTDYVGPWVATGTYEPQTGVCQWTKQYLGKHLVDYQGICNSSGIQGEWSILMRGPFHIWPRRDGHLTELYLREEEQFSSEIGPSILLEPVFDDELA